MSILKRIHFEDEAFDDSKLDQAINMLVYGFLIAKVGSDGVKTHPRVYYIHESYQPYALQYTGRTGKKSYLQRRVDLSKLKFVVTAPSDEKYLKKYNAKNLLTFCVESRITVLLFSSEEERKLWQQGLHYFIVMSQHTTLSFQHVLLEKIFEYYDRDGNKTLSKEELQEMQALINFKKPLIEGQEPEEEIDQDYFIKNMESIIDLTEIKPIFQKYCSIQVTDLDKSKPYMTLDELNTFYYQEQGSDQSQQIKTRLKEGFFGTGSFINWKVPCVTLGAFTELLLGHQNSIFDDEFNQDMSQPLTDYYINSSHNTYLSEDQLVGESSTLAYVQALERGCRCLEIDCWDGEDMRPIVYHGYTLTSKILFSDVIKTINERAFESNPYPVILTIELHCSLEQQKAMGEILVSVLGKKLYFLPEDFDRRTKFPSPNDLKERVLIKSSGSLEKAVELLFNKKLGQNYEDIEEDQEEEKLVTPAQYQLPDSQYKQTLEIWGKLQQQTKGKIHPQFVTCLSLFNLSFSNRERTIWHVSSIDESKTANLVSSNLELIRNITRKNIIRCYPAGTRIGSGNYEPTKAFYAGIQTYDHSLLLNISKFMQNGGDKCGYVLKPLMLTSKFEGLSLVSNKLKLNMKIKIISGQNLHSETKISLNPKVEIQVKGSQIDESANRPQRTIQSEGNGLNPKFNQEMNFQFCDPEFAFLYFQIFEPSLPLQDKRIGWYAVPVLCVRTGYRIIPIRDEKLNLLDDSFLFVNIRNS